MSYLETIQNESRAIKKIDKVIAALPQESVAKVLAHLVEAHGGKKHESAK